MNQELNCYNDKFILYLVNVLLLNSFMLKVKPIIMAGGSGTRLWPMSRGLYPKQFIKLFNGLSLLQQTLVRNKEFGKSVVIVSKVHRFIAAEQIREVGIEADLIVEPLQKNTAPCALIGALLAKEDHTEIVLLLPADHHIANDQKYIDIINKSFTYADRVGIVTIGIKPTFPSVGFGYIKVGSRIDAEAYTAEKFIEKPSAKIAEEYLAIGGYFWNSGIFVYTPEFMLDQAKNLQQQLLDQVSASFAKSSKDLDFLRLDSKHYAGINAISVDCAIMIYLSNIVFLEGDFGWNDLGSWNSLWLTSDKDSQNNYIEGDVITHEVTHSYIKSKNKLTAVMGLDNIIIINTEDALLIANKSKADDLECLVKKISLSKRAKMRTE